MASRLVCINHANVRPARRAPAALRPARKGRTGFAARQAHQAKRRLAARHKAARRREGQVQRRLVELELREVQAAAARREAQRVADLRARERRASLWADAQARVAQASAAAAVLYGTRAAHAKHRVSAQGSSCAPSLRKEQ